MVSYKTIQVAIQPKRVRHFAVPPYGDRAYTKPPFARKAVNP
jgi:hypothetical protein